MLDFDDFGDSLTRVFGAPAKGSLVDKMMSGGSSTPAPVASTPTMTAADEQAAAGAVSSTMPQAQPLAAPVATQPAPVAAAPAMLPAQETTTQASVSPALMRKANKILDDQEKAQKALTEAQISQNHIIAADNTNRALMLQKEADDAATLIAERNKVADRKIADIQAAVQDYSDNRKVNPNRYMENLGTGGRVLAAIASAFGAFGSAITHSPNYAQNMIDRAIDADIRSQEAEVAARGAKVNMLTNQYALFRSKGMDEDAARLAVRTLRLQQAQAKVEELIAKSADPKTVATGQQIIAGLQERSNNNLMEYGKTVKSTVKVSPLAGGGGTQLPAHEAVNLGTANAAVDVTKDLYKKWDKDGRGVISWLTSFLPNTDSSRYEDSRKMAKQIIGGYLEGGVLRKEDEEKYEAYLPKVGDSKATASNRTNSLLALVASRQREQKKALGGAGYNVSGIKENYKPVTTFQPSK